VEKEIKKFFGYVRTGMPMFGIIMFFVLMLGGVLNTIPPLTLPLGVIIFVVFSCAALGIIKEIADK